MSAGVVTRWSAPERVVSPTPRRSRYSDVGISTGCHQQPLPAINTSPVPAVFVSLAGLRTARQSGNRKPAPSTACDSFCFIQSPNPMLECFSFRDLRIVHPYPFFSLLLLFAADQDDLAFKVLYEARRLRKQSDTGRAFHYTLTWHTDDGSWRDAGEMMASREKCWESGTNPLSVCLLNLE